MIIEIEKTLREHKNRSKNLSWSAWEMKNNNMFKRCRCAMKMQQRSSGITKNSSWFLCERRRLITASELQYWALRHLNAQLSSSVALLGALTLSYCYGEPSSFILQVYQIANPLRIHCACSKCALSLGKSRASLYLFCAFNMHLQRLNVLLFIFFCLHSMTTKWYRRSYCFLGVSTAYIVVHNAPPWCFKCAVSNSPQNYIL